MLLKRLKRFQRGWNVIKEGGTLLKRMECYFERGEHY